VGGTTENEKDRHSPCLLFFIKKSKKIKVQSPSRLFSKGLEAILVGVV